MPEFKIGDRVFVKYPKDTQGAHAYVVPLRVSMYDPSVSVMVEFQPEITGTVAIRFVAELRYVTLSPDLCPESFTCSVCKRERTPS